MLDMPPKPIGASREVETMSPTPDVSSGVGDAWDNPTSPKVTPRRRQLNLFTGRFRRKNPTSPEHGVDNDDSVHGDDAISSPPASDSDSDDPLSAFLAAQMDGNPRLNKVGSLRLSTEDKVTKCCLVQQ